MDVVGADVRIRTRSMSNVETVRLVARLEFLRGMFAGGYSAPVANDGRNTFGAFVRETVNVERELTRRGVPFVCVTDGRHLAVSVTEVPVMNPPLSRREREAGVLR